MIRSLQEPRAEDVLVESYSGDFDVRSFVKDVGKEQSFRKHFAYFSKKYPHARSCDVEDSISKALSEMPKANPKTLGSAKSLFKRKVRQHLSELSDKSKSVKKNLSCLGSLKSISLKGLDLEELIGRAKSILTSKEKMALNLCSSGHSVRDMAEIMNTSSPTAWRVLNKALDKVRISNGMKSRNKDRR